MAFIVFIDQPLQAHWVIKGMLVLGTVFLGWATWFLVIMFPRIDAGVFLEWQEESMRREGWNNNMGDWMVKRA
ncbi:hypothetical protein KJS94_15500 [Flavihumibacter rivuli]|uniref:hypothetical protein n=1 Tax=Flavihumibacter rivuli TaxID=2838156 RepID=UPI001BDEE583|nr:hypothetical protein [Flavihumibacter rivuli]ULQ56053.1 hypothetical protein KJS94_15500 [Flavihumibacter rivuli]